MRQYLDFLRHILTYGRWSDNRTGMPTKKDFGYSMYFDLSTGEFPLVTTKKLNLKAIVHELIWFLRGDTNNELLEQHGVTIWREWALPDNLVERREIHYNDRVALWAQQIGISQDVAFDRMHEISMRGGFAAANAQLDADGIPLHEEIVIMPKGSLGPIYGHQWRSWELKPADPNDPYGAPTVHDQIAEIIHQLRTNPNSRRILVSAWNVKDLPDETKSPHQNVADGKMALAPCHVLFQFGTLPMTRHERMMWMVDEFDRRHEGEESPLLDDDMRAYYEAVIEKRVSEQEIDKYMDERQIPKYFLNCQLYQRSADAFLGVPFNIASYALLTHMVAQVVGMAPGKFVHTFGDFHIYQNHVEQVELQLTRDPLPAPRLKLNRNVKELTDFTFEDIEFVDYKYHPPIKGAVSV